MHRAPRQRVEIGRQGRDQSLAFAGAHFRDAALMQHHATDQLLVKMPQTEHALAGFPYHSEGFRQQVVERFASGEARAKFGGLGPQLSVAQGHGSAF